MIFSKPTSQLTSSPRHHPLRPPQSPSPRAASAPPAIARYPSSRNFKLGHDPDPGKSFDTNFGDPTSSTSREGRKVVDIVRLAEAAGLVILVSRNIIVLITIVLTSGVAVVPDTRSVSLFHGRWSTITKLHYGGQGESLVPRYTRGSVAFSRTLPHVILRGSGQKPGASSYTRVHRYLASNYTLAFSHSPHHAFPSFANCVPGVCVSIRHLQVTLAAVAPALVPAAAAPAPRAPARPA